MVNNPSGNGRKLLVDFGEYAPELATLAPKALRIDMAEAPEDATKSLAPVSRFGDFDADQIREDIQQTVLTILDSFDSEEIAGHEMQVDEVEFTLCINKQGGVSIASWLTGGIEKNKTFTVRLKHKS